LAYYFNYLAKLYLIELNLNGVYFYNKATILRVLYSKVIVKLEKNK